MHSNSDKIHPDDSSSGSNGNGRENATPASPSPAPAPAATPASAAGAAGKLEETEVVRRILRALAGLDYGSVEIIVQDSRVVQIERTQRSRFSRPLEIPPQHQG